MNVKAASAAAASAPSGSHNDSYFRTCPTAARATSLVDGVPLVVPVMVAPSEKKKGGKSSSNTNDSNKDEAIIIMPWIAFGTYKLGGSLDTVRRAVFDALSAGYRHIDTAFIYGQEKTEIQVGLAIRDALQQNILASRQEVFITTKHWRTHHGYEPTLECLKLSLQRLQLDYIDLWLMVRKNTSSSKNKKEGE